MLYLGLLTEINIIDSKVRAKELFQKNKEDIIKTGIISILKVSKVAKRYL